MSPPSYQLAAVSNGYPGPYQPTQEHSVEGQSPTQYSVTSEANSPDDLPFKSDMPDMQSPPDYWEFDIEKGSF